MITLFAVLNPTNFSCKTGRRFQAMRLLVQSNTKTSHWRNCWMDDDDLDELYEDVVDSLPGTYVTHMPLGNELGS